MPRKPTTPKQKGPATLDGSRADTKTAKALDIKTIGAEGPKIKRILGKQWVKFAYTDALGHEREESLSGRTAKRFMHMWWKRQEGLSQAEVPKGYTLKDYVYKFATCDKAAYYLPFRRAWEPHDGGQHRRYWLNANIEWLAEHGFPEIRGHLKPKKG